MDRRHGAGGQNLRATMARQARGTAPPTASPTHESKSWIASAPARAFACTYAANVAASFAISASQSSGSDEHQALRERQLAIRPSLDEIAGDGKGAAAKTDHGLLRRELGAHEADRLEHRRERLVRVGYAKPIDVRERSDRPLDDRADTLDELDVDTHAEHGSHDVCKQNCCVDVVTPDGLQRHLCAQLGRSGEIEEGVTLTE